MKRRMLILMVIVVVVCLSSTALAQPDRTTAPGSAIMSGDHYRLSSVMGWRVAGAVSGGRYQLAPLAGEGCCCISLLPCVFK